MIIVGILIALVVLFLILGAGSWIVAMNINDMLANGVDGWNVFWILLVLVLLIGSSSKAAD